MEHAIYSNNSVEIDEIIKIMSVTFNLNIESTDFTKKVISEAVLV